jgi:CelD/BcsL family acetyltransferase involved in cellulose biosynthesis
VGRIALHPIVLSIDVVSTLEGLRALKRDYERLERVTGNTLPFALHDWHLTWCEHLLNRHPQREELLQLFVLRNRSGDCVALVPLVLQRWRLGPVRFATLTSLGSDEGVTEIRGALIEPGYEQPSVRSVYQRALEIPGWTWLHWQDANEALASALTRELKPHWQQTRDDCLLDLPQTWEEFRAGLSRNVRESLRRCYNSLRRDGHQFDFVVAREPAEVMEALPRFFELHALRAGMPRVPLHPNRFASPLLRRFVTEVCAKMSARDAVRVFQLRVDGAIVASRVAFVVSDTLYLYYSGFDPSWARYGVMTTAEAEAFRYAIAQGVRSVNLSLWAGRSKLRWRPRRLELRSGLVSREALGSRLACRAYCLATASQGLPAQLLRRLQRRYFSWR